MTEVAYVIGLLSATARLMVSADMTPNHNTQPKRQAAGWIATSNHLFSHVGPSGPGIPGHIPMFDLHTIQVIQAPSTLLLCCGSLEPGCSWCEVITQCQQGPPGAHSQCLISPQYKIQLQRTRQADHRRGPTASQKSSTDCRCVSSDLVNLWSNCDSSFRNVPECLLSRFPAEEHDYLLARVCSYLMQAGITLLSQASSLQACPYRTTSVLALAKIAELGLSALRLIFLCDEKESPPVRVLRHAPKGP